MLNKRTRDPSNKGKNTAILKFFLLSTSPPPPPPPPLFVLSLINIKSTLIISDIKWMFIGAISQHCAFAQKRHVTKLDSASHIEYICIRTEENINVRAGLWLMAAKRNSSSIYIFKEIKTELYHLATHITSCVLNPTLPNVQITLYVAT